MNDTIGYNHIDQTTASTVFHHHHHYRHHRHQSVRGPNVSPHLLQALDGLQTGISGSDHPHSIFTEQGMPFPRPCPVPQLQARRGTQSRRRYAIFSRSSTKRPQSTTAISLAFSFDIILSPLAYVFDESIALSRWKRQWMTARNKRLLLRTPLAFTTRFRSICNFI
jgi:hypothetical protein